MDLWSIIIGILVLFGLYAIYKQLCEMHKDTNDWFMEFEKTNRKLLESIYHRLDRLEKKD